MGQTIILLFLDPRCGKQGRLPFFHKCLNPANKEFAFI
jgi:hypothetical protein